jgi:hypothetical protein
MIRTLAFAIALLSATPSFAAELTDPHSQTPSIDDAAPAEAAKPKRKSVKGETSDYLIVTLKEVSIS